MKTYQEKYFKYKKKYQDLKNKLAKNKFKLSGGGNKTLVLIKAEWCGYCQKFKSVWEKLPGELNNINFKVLDSELNQDEIKKYDFKGYPSIYLEYDNRKIEYKGNRSLEDIKNFVLEN